MPAMKEYLIRRSKEATGRDKSWDDATYESIDWRHHGEVLKKLSNGRRIQISKYAQPNDDSPHLTTEWTHDVSHASSYGRTPPTC